MKITGILCQPEVQLLRNYHLNEGFCVGMIAVAQPWFL